MILDWQTIYEMSLKLSPLLTIPLSVCTTTSPGIRKAGACDESSYLLLYLTFGETQQDWNKDSLKGRGNCRKNIIEIFQRRSLRWPDRKEKEVNAKDWNKEHCSSDLLHLVTGRKVPSWYGWWCAELPHQDVHHIGEKDDIEDNDNDDRNPKEPVAFPHVHPAMNILMILAIHNVWDYGNYWRRPSKQAEAEHTPVFLHERGYK